MPELTKSGVLVRRRNVRAALVVFGICATVVFSYLSVRGVNLDAAWRAFRGSEAWWFLPSLVALGLAVVCRAQRWRYLFEAASRPSSGVALSAYLVGQFFNSILPLRAGEPARIVAVHRRTGTSLAETSATVVLERVLDVFCLLLILLIILPWLPHLSWVGTAALVTAGLAGLLGAAAIALRGGRERPLRLLVAPLRLLPGFTEERTQGVARNLRSGLAAVRSLRVFLVALLLTVLSWLVLAASFWLLARAFELPHSPLLGILVVVATNVAQILPSAPAAVGVFEASAIVAVTAYDVPRATALSYALVLHTLNLLPYLIAGPIALRFTPVAGFQPLRRDDAVEATGEAQRGS